MSKIHRIPCYNATTLKYNPIIVDHPPNLENIHIIPYYLGLIVPYISVESGDSAIVDNIGIL